MVDDTYYITPHEAALAVVATAMKKSRLPFYILFINSIMGGFLFSAGSMLYVMCESGSSGIQDGAGMFVYLIQGGVYAIGLFYVIVCGMELFNSNILFFSVGVFRGAVTFMDLAISWFVSFWVNLASTIFVVYVFCYCSGIFKQEIYVNGTIEIAQFKDSFSFAETLLKAIAGNFFVCLAVYLQIMVKPLHVKFLLIFLPIFTFVAMGFTHVVADMFLVPSGIFNNCGFGFGHYFWKIMLPGAIGNIIGGSFFGIVIPWFLHLQVIEHDMKKLNLPAYEERDEQPMLNMDSRVVRVPTTSSTISSVKEFRPDDENNISKVTTNRTSLSSGLSRVTTNASVRSRLSRVTSKQIRSPKGVFPVADMGQPLMREKTIASAYIPSGTINEEPPNNLDDLVDEINDTDNTSNNASSNSNDSQSSADEEIPLSGYSKFKNKNNNDIANDNDVDSIDNTNDLDDEAGDYIPNPYNPEQDKVGSKLIRALSRTVTKNKDLETGETTKDERPSGLAKIITRTATRIGHDLELDTDKIIPPPKAATKDYDISSNKIKPTSTASKSSKLSSNKLFRQFTFGGGGNDTDEIHRRLSQAKITRKAAGMSNDIAGIHESTIDKKYHTESLRRNSVDQTRKASVASSSDNKNTSNNSSKIQNKNNNASNNFRHVNFDYEYDGERPVSFISEHTEETNDAKDKPNQPNK